MFFSNSTNATNFLLSLRYFSTATTSLDSRIYPLQQTVTLYHYQCTTTTTSTIDLILPLQELRLLNHDLYCHQTTRKLTADTTSLHQYSHNQTITLYHPQYSTSTLMSTTSSSSFQHPLLVYRKTNPFLNASYFSPMFMYFSLIQLRF